MSVMKVIGLGVDSTVEVGSTTNGAIRLVGVIRV